MDTIKPNSWRVKLYQLNEEGQWDDRGTGQIRVAHVDELGGVGVHVVSEETGVDLLQSRILEDREAYSLQGENIITWEERRPLPAQPVDLALSFQENDGCLEIWNQIQEVQGRFASVAGASGGSGGSGAASPALDGDGGDDDEHGIMVDPYEVSSDSLLGAMSQELRALPECRLGNAAAICEQLSNASPMHRAEYANMLLDSEGDYLRKLSGMFGDCEDLEDAEGLKLIAHTMRAVVLLNDGRLLEHLLTEEEIYESVVGALEYDPELKERATTREFLKHKARFREAVPMDSDPELRAKIKTTFRAVLLRDAVMRPGMDDSAISGLIQFIYFAYSDILSRLYTNSEYLRQVVLVCAGRDPATSTDEHQTPALYFLQEMCNIAKGSCVSMQTRDSLFTYMLHEVPLFEALCNVLTRQERRRCAAMALAEREALPKGDMSSSSLSSSSTRKPAAAADAGDDPAAVAAADPRFGAEVGTGATGGGASVRERLAVTEVLASAVSFDSASSFRMHVLNTGTHPPNPPWSQNQNAGSQQQLQQHHSYSHLLQPAVCEDAAVRASDPMDATGVEASSNGSGNDGGGDSMSDGNGSNGSENRSGCADSSSGGSDGGGGGGGGSSSGDGSNSGAHGSESAFGAGTAVGSNEATAAKKSPSTPLSSSSSAMPNILALVLHGLAHDADTGVLLHYNEVLSKCIDTEGLDATERDGFLTVFYDFYIQWLVDPFMMPAGSARPSSPADNSLSAPSSASSFTSSPSASSSASPLPAPPAPAAAAAAATTAAAAAAAAATGATSSASVPSGVNPSAATSVPPDPEVAEASTDAVPTLKGSSGGGRGKNGVVPLTDAQKAARGHACDLLSFCVRAHTYRMKYFVLRNNLVGRILELMKYEDKFLKLAALRFVRACVGVRDDFLNRHLVKKDHLAPVFALFKANHPKDNLISSAIIDLVEYIRSENIKSLVEHIVDKFMHCFEGVEHVTTFKDLVLKHEQNLELRSASRHEHGVGGSVDGGLGPGGGHMSAIAAAEWRKARELDDDEAYFETSDDSDDQETTSTGAHASGSPLSGSAGILALDRMGGLGGASSDSSNAVSSGDDASDTSDDGDSLTGGVTGRITDSPPHSPGQSSSVLGGTVVGVNTVNGQPSNLPPGSDGSPGRSVGRGPPDLPQRPSSPPVASSNEGLGRIFEGIASRTAIGTAAPVRMTMRINATNVGGQAPPSAALMRDGVGDGGAFDADADDDDDDARTAGRLDRSPESSKRQKR